MSLKPSSDALVAHLQGEAVLLHAGTKDYFRLNETGQVVWRMIEQGSDEDAIVAALLEAYDVDAEEARAEVQRIVRELIDAGLLVSAP